MTITADVTTGYLLILTTMLSLLEPQGLVWTLTTAGAGIGAGAAAFMLIKRTGRQSFTALFPRNRNASGGGRL
jgi:hypothetical protein